jgi:hypothetical protein
MATAALGKLEYVSPNEVWTGERAFSDWLLTNADSLGAVLGLDLEMKEREAAVGDFALDLLGREIGSGRTVIVENQFGPTDHDHLGKLMTYAAAHRASICV